MSNVNPPPDPGAIGATLDMLISSGGQKIASAGTASCGHSFQFKASTAKSCAVLPQMTLNSGQKNTDMINMDEAKKK